MPNERGRGLLKKTKNNFWNLESMSPDDDDDDDSDDGDIITVIMMIRLF